MGRPAGQPGGASRGCATRAGFLTLSGALPAAQALAWYWYLPRWRRAEKRVRRQAYRAVLSFRQGPPTGVWARLEQGERLPRVAPDPGLRPAMCRPPVPGQSRAEAPRPAQRLPGPGQGRADPAPASAQAGHWPEAGTARSATLRRAPPEPWRAYLRDAPVQAPTLAQVGGPRHPRAPTPRYPARPSPLPQKAQPRAAHRPRRVAGGCGSESSSPRPPP
jgi:hypothetical protein